MGIFKGSFDTRKISCRANLVLLILIGIMAGVLTAGPYLSAQMSPGTINAKQSGTWTVQPGNTANSTAWLVTGTGGTFPVTTGSAWPVKPDGTTWAMTTTSANVNVTNASIPTVPGPLTSIVTNQQAVTASAVVLPTNTAKRVCLKVLIAGTQVVYFGPSGVTTGTGMELSPGDAWCGSVSNSNLIYVIAAGTGSTVAFEVEN